MDKCIFDPKMGHFVAFFRLFRIPEILPAVRPSGSFSPSMKPMKGLPMYQIPAAIRIRTTRRPMLIGITRAICPERKSAMAHIGQKKR